MWVGQLHLENAPESTAVPGQGVVLVFDHRIAKGGESSGQMDKAYGIRPNNIGKSQRVRNDELLEVKRVACRAK
jgi:hypothetical protein